MKPLASVTLWPSGFVTCTARWPTEPAGVRACSCVGLTNTTLVAATPLSNFIGRNPTVVMLALGFLLMIGMALIAEGFGAKVPKGYIYAAMAFSAFVEGLNILARRARKRARDAGPSGAE